MLAFTRLSGHEIGRKRRTPSRATVLHAVGQLPSDSAVISGITVMQSSFLDISSSTPLILADAIGTSTPATRYDAMVPDSTALAGFAATVVVCIVAAWVWSTQVVPVSRTKLALSKRNGPVRDYLDDLRQAAAASSAGSRTMNNTATETRLETESIDATEASSVSNRAFERWLFTDWLQQRQQGMQTPRKEPALPILKTAKWNSGDNPVLAATALILLGVVITSVTERIATLSL